MPIHLDPQAKRFLRRLNALSTLGSLARMVLPIGYKDTIAAVRHGLRAAIPLAGAPEAVFEVSDVGLPGPDGPIPLRIYRPRSGPGLPVLVYMHGGGFTSGDLDTHDTMLRSLANRAECVVLSVGYRLAPEYKFPAGLDDSLAAFEWVYSHADQVGVDPRRMAVGGDSAGGTLAALLAQQAGRRVVFQLLLYPCTDLSMTSQSWQQLGKGYGLDHDSAEGWHQAYLPPGVSPTDPRVSPLYATHLVDVAPALIITGEADPLKDDGAAYAARLRQSQILVEHTCYPGMIHGFASLAGVIDAGGQAINQSAAALRKAFGTPPA